MVVPNWLLRETFMVEHNPNCSSPFLVRLVGKGKGYIRRNSDDVRGYGQTLEDAATMAMKLAGKFTAVETRDDLWNPHGNDGMRHMESADVTGGATYMVGRCIHGTKHTDGDGCPHCQR